MPPPFSGSSPPSTVTLLATGLAVSGMNRKSLDDVVAAMSTNNASRLAPARRREVGESRARVMVWARPGSEEGARQPAVDGDHRAGDVRRALGGEERGNRPDLGGGAEPAERDPLECLRGRPVVAVELAHALGVDLARCDRVDGDPGRSELTRQGLEPADHPGPDRVRESEPVDGPAHGGRLDRQDAAVPARAEVG